VRSLNGGFARSKHTSTFRRSAPYSPYTSLPFPFFNDSFDPDDIYSTGYPVASELPPFLLQAAAALAGSDYRGNVSAPYDDRQPTSQPLMIELQNGRYVRVRSPGDDSEAKDAEAKNGAVRDGNIRELTLAPQNARSPAASSPAPDLLPAVIVFRDGHSEEVRDYTIADGILYARGDYYTQGYWNKKIALSTLNLAQTIQANTSRNVRFVLPTSPNEVITRP
jgi:hypothetical protein